MKIEVKKGGGYLVKAETNAEYTLIVRDLAAGTGFYELVELDKEVLVEDSAVEWFSVDEL